jgi:hypothetical protein
MFQQFIGDIIEISVIGVFLVMVLAWAAGVAPLTMA